MHGPSPEIASAPYPGLRDIVWFAIRAKGLQLKRALANLAVPVSRLPCGDPTAFPIVLAESVTPLDTGVDSRERSLLLGKYQNLRMACRRLHQTVLDAGATFSFWRQVGPPWRWRGFVPGREVRAGCVIPTTGGGLCQLSGSLLEVALQLGFELLERHRHTALPADVAYSEPRDATLFWNYVDLRFRSPCRVMLETYLTPDTLVVRVRGDSATPPPLSRLAPVSATRKSPRTDLQSCYVCGNTACRRCEMPADTRVTGKTAYLLDQYQPEYDRYIQTQRTTADTILVPFEPRHGRRTWNRNGFASSQSISGFRWQQALLLRLAVARGISVAAAHFSLARSLARRYAARLTLDTDELCVSQALLPHLWQLGALGGRCFDVLMYRGPIALMQQQLNIAAQQYPEATSLKEFRAPAGIAEAEHEALQAARRIITPHAQIASQFPEAMRLDWVIDGAAVEPQECDSKRDLVLFCGPTLARKGAYAVREALRRLDFPLHVMGEDLEESGFWEGLPVTHVRRENIPWQRVYAVIQPALFEYWPRDLLQAHGAGAQLVISAGCGIEQDEAGGIYHVPFGDVQALHRTLSEILARKITL